MKIDIISIFPSIFDSYFGESIIKRAQEKELVDINIYDLRDYSKDKHRKVDDKPFGGGAGMVMMIEPIHLALEELRSKNSVVIATTAKGANYKQSTAIHLSKKEHIIILCGHYEGFDQRILDNLVDMNLSIGDFVMTGGEIAAMAITDSIVRLQKGALGNEESSVTDSFYEDDETIQYPNYTRPASYNIDDKTSLEVPNILLSGNHKEIDNWRESNKIKKT